MKIKQIAFWAVCWIVTVAISTAVAMHSVLAQNLVPPPPVIGIPDPALSRLEIKLDAIDRRIASQGRVLKAIYAKLFPLKMEQGIQDAPALDD